MKTILRAGIMSILGLMGMAGFASGQSLDDIGELFGESTETPGTQPTEPTQPSGSSEDVLGGLGGSAAPEAPKTQEEAVQQIRDAMSQADSLRSEGKFGEAIAAYSRILATYPDLVEVQFERAKTYLMLKEYNFALVEFNAILENYLTAQNPDFLSAVQIERGRLYVLLQDYEAALQDLDQAVRLNPSSAELYMLRGKALTRLGQLAGVQGQPQIRQALNSLDRAIELNSDYAEAYSERAQTNFLSQEYDKAVEDIARALSLNPDDSNSLGREGVYRSRRASYEKNRYDADMDQVVADLEAAMASFDKYLAREGNKTRDAFRDVPAETVTPDSIYAEKAATEIELAGILENDRSGTLYRAAIDDCNAAAKYDDRSWVPLYQRGIAQRMAGDLTSAIESFTAAIRLQPAPESFLRRGMAFYHLGEFARARADFVQAAEMQPRDARAKFWIGLTYASEGEFIDAIRLYSEALRDNPEYKPAYNNRGLAYLQTRQFRRAANDFEELLRRDHTDPVARQRRDRALQLDTTEGF